MRRSFVALSAGLALAAALTPGAFAQTGHTGHGAPARPQAITKAIAVLIPTQNSSVRGTVTFTRLVSRVRVVADIEGLTPGPHGFHIHEFGDASSPDGTSAGGHFNPTNEPHAGPDARARHVGDLGNITADASGRAQLDVVMSGLRFDGPTSILGRGVVVHEKADDLRTQPTGDAGGRLAVGVIGVAQQ